MIYVYLYIYIHMNMFFFPRVLYLKTKVIKTNWFGGTSGKRNTRELHENDCITQHDIMDIYGSFDPD